MLNDYLERVCVCVGGVRTLKKDFLICNLVATTVASGFIHKIFDNLGGKSLTSLSCIVGALIVQNRIPPR